MVFGLDNNVLQFPDPALADEDGLLAIGGDLKPERLIKAYQQGIFPWFSEGDPILWFAPHERCVVLPEEVKVSKSMAKLLKTGFFSLTINQAFEQVIRSCAKLDRTKQGQDGTWITEDMQQAYIKLFHMGVARSLEVWHDGLLVGGLYGVTMNRVFCGESMFSLMSNASKFAFIKLCQGGEFDLIDCQLPNDHLMSLGAVLIPAADYLKILNRKTND
jgi:leucyl/phenylalanyl-tRNA--protein transferase